VTGLIKWEFEYTLFAFQDELVDRLLSIKDEIFLKHKNTNNVEITGTIYVLDDKKVYTILDIISFHYDRRQIALTIYSSKLSHHNDLTIDVHKRCFDFNFK
jgi:hypothetical protein